MRTLARKDLLRFKGKVEESGANACWPWDGQRDKDGYGQFGHAGRTLRAHRVAYFVANGSFPNELQVLHHCDNPPCCNPGHLWLGTNADNRRDSYEKGRHVVCRPRGEEHGNAKLTKQAVLAIRATDVNPRGTRRRLAEKYGVSDVTISLVLSRKVWAHV